MKYVELHARSAFSFLEGASVPEALTNIGAAMNMPAMALLDRNGFYGSPRFHMSAKKIGMRAHVGAEITVAEGEAAAEGKAADEKAGTDGSGPVNYPLLCESRAGYQNLCRLLTKTKLRVPKHAASVGDPRRAGRACSGNGLPYRG